MKRFDDFANHHPLFDFLHHELTTAHTPCANRFSNGPKPARIERSSVHFRLISDTNRKISRYPRHMSKMSRLTPESILESPPRVMAQPASNLFHIEGIDAAKDLLYLYFQSKRHEHLCSIYMNAEGIFCGMRTWKGNTDFIDFPIRQILSSALESEASLMILAHNHPSGDPNPSKNDIQSTRILSRICSAIDIIMLDHFIFSGEKSISMRTLNML